MLNIGDIVVTSIDIVSHLKKGRKGRIKAIDNPYYLVDFGKDFEGHDGGFGSGNLFWVRNDNVIRHKKGNYNNYV